LAPNSPLRAAATAYAREQVSSPAVPAPQTLVRAPREEKAAGSPARYHWAILLARLLESSTLTCPNCGADMRIVAVIIEAGPVQRILIHIGEPAELPPLAPARGPPAWDGGLADAVPDWDALAQPEPDYLFD
jgi:hypothetical protein